MSMRRNALPLACELTLIHSGWYEMHFPFKLALCTTCMYGSTVNPKQCTPGFFVPSVQQLKSTNSYLRVFGAIRSNNRTSNLLNRDSWESRGLVLNGVTATFKNLTDCTVMFCFMT